MPLASAGLYNDGGSCILQPLPGDFSPIPSSRRPMHPPMRSTLLEQVSSLSGKGILRVYIEERGFDGHWVLRFGGSIDSALAFLEVCPLGAEIRLRPAEDASSLIRGPETAH